MNKPLREQKSPKYRQGTFSPKNPKKYKGDHNKIIYRSSWELMVFKWLDTNENVIWWGSEELHIPYFSPVDSKWHRYFPDILAQVKTIDGKVKTYLIEIKPKAQVQEPKKPNRITKRYINEVCTYGINTEKWKAARIFCEKQNWEFMIMTEDDIFGKSRR